MDSGDRATVYFRAMKMYKSLIDDFKVEICYVVIKLYKSRGVVILFVKRKGL